MTRVRRTLCILESLVLIAILFTPVAAMAQVSTAQLNGRVTDTSSAVLPGVMNFRIERSLLAGLRQNRGLQIRRDEEPGAASECLDFRLDRLDVSRAFASE